MGDARSVCGLTWLKWWNGGDDFKLGQSGRSFRFGDGPLIRSPGAIIIFIHANQQCDDPNKPFVLPVSVDVMDSNAPWLVPHESLRKMKGPIDFTEPILTTECGIKIKIKLTRTLSGHLMIEGQKADSEMSKNGMANPESISAMEIRLPVKSLTLEELKRIRLR